MKSSNAIGQYSRNVFETNKTYRYKTIYIDGITGQEIIEYIELLSTGNQWVAQKSKQSELLIKFAPDSSAICKLFDPRKGTKRKNFKSVVSHSKEGIYQTDSSFFMHPIRCNQFVYTQIAPFPEIDFNKLQDGESWSNMVIIISGWGKFRGKTFCQYQPSGLVEMLFKNEIIHCYQINATSTHRRLGNSNLTMLYSEEYGMLSMYYEFYDGTKILFQLT